jgi:hypothetical protein
MRQFFGFKNSQERSNKISAALKGVPKSEEHRQKISISGKKRFERLGEREKISVGHKGKHCGNKHYRWKGGLSFEPYCEKFNEDLKERVRGFFGYICILCGTPQNGEKLHVHHVNFDKMVCCDNTKPLFVPLCRSCHSKTNHKREYYEQHFTEMITMKYDGKCYLDKCKIYESV